MKNSAKSVKQPGKNSSPLTSSAPTPRGKKNSETSTDTLQQSNAALKKNLDSILDDALDDFEQQELQSKVADLATRADIGDVATTNVDPIAARRAEAEKMKGLMDQLNDPKFGNTLGTTLQSLSSTNGGIENVESLFSELNRQYETNLKSSILPLNPDDPEAINNGDRQVAGTLQMLGAAQQGMEGFEVSKLEDAGEQMMEDMMAQFEALGEKEDYNEVIDGVMKQLLSRDLMYDPIKQVCEKFPAWLAINRQNLSESEYTNYGKQYMIFQRLLAVYDIEPDNFPRLMELMFDIQQYGQPPADIIKDLAPGLQFDENGMPIMPNMGSGVLPEMPGGPIIPNLGEATSAMAGGQCAIM